MLAILSYRNFTLSQLPTFSFLFLLRPARSFVCSDRSDGKDRRRGLRNCTRCSSFAHPSSALCLSLLPHEVCERRASCLQLTRSRRSDAVSPRPGPTALSVPPQPPSCFPSPPATTL